MSSDVQHWPTMSKLIFGDTVMHMYCHPIHGLDVQSANMCNIRGAQTAINHKLI